MFDTIAAISTPIGAAGIGIVRVSGDEAIQVVSNIFLSKKGIDLSEVKSHTIHLGYIVDKNGDVIDEVLVTVMRSPKTFTREDIVEINCHGGVVVLREVLELVLRSGARLAEPGEFTKRAFVNGRIDLAQAESIMDIINAKSEVGLKLAMNQLGGKISGQIGELRNEILRLMGLIEVNIDFSEEDVPEVQQDEIVEQVGQMINKIKKLVSTVQNGKVYREGLATVIIGKPNVGKSSLLNALLKEKRAIVTDIPGTTRDVIEEILNLDGIPLKIIDTAGIRESENLVEQIGIERSRESLNRADIVLFVLDNASGITAEDLAILDEVKNKKTIILVNKIDLAEKNIPDEYLNELLPGLPILRISAKEEIGLEDLAATIKEMVLTGDVEGAGYNFITHTRHAACLERAMDSLTSVVESLKQSLPFDLLAIDLKNAWETLGEITGETIGEDLLDHIFSEFCLGK